MDMKAYAQEITRTKRELMISVSKPDHVLQPKTIHEVRDEDDKLIWVGWVYITSIRNREKKTYGDKDARGNERSPVVVEATVNLAAKCIVDGTAVLSSDQEIQQHFAATEKGREVAGLAIGKEVSL